MSAADGSFVKAVRAALADDGDPERAAAQQAYMKSSLPYHGITAPRLKTILKPLLAEYAPVSRDEHEATVLDLWNGVTHREEWYATVAMIRHPRTQEWLDPDALALLRHLISSGAWWDVVDELASHPVANVLFAHRDAVTPTMREWAVDDDPWIRRTAVICQLRAGADTDLDLLRFTIESNVDDTSFWLRKAIGWALRQYARTDPDWVRTEVDQLGARLSGLSRREAMKHLSKESAS